MSQSVRTVVFLVTAAVAAATAYITRPRPQAARLAVDISRPLFESFKDPQQAGRIRIVRIDEELGQFIEFELTRDEKTKLWRIPSEHNYPADQEDRIRDAVTAFVDLTPIDKVADQSAKHELLGVVEPKSDLEVSQKGTGTLVIIESTSGDTLARLIIGKQGKRKNADENDAESGDEQLFFVRKPNEDVVYIVKLKPDVFSTDFDKWIDKNLLKIDSFDIEGMAFRDYTVPYDIQQSQQGAAIRPNIEQINHKMGVDLRWDSRQAKWKLERFITYAQGRPIVTKLDDTEELNSLKLDDIKRAVAQLELVGVRPKPEGLGADLKAGRKFLDKRENVISLMQRGFFPRRTSDDQVELVAENGEMIVSTRDGVQYVLRFGGTAALNGDTGENSGELTRFLMVTAQIDESQFTELPPEARRAPADKKPIGPQAESDKRKSDQGKAKGDGKKLQTPPKAQPPAPLGQPPEEAEQKNAENKKTAGKASESPQTDSPPSSSATKKPDEKPAGEKGDEKADGTADEATSSDSAKPDPKAEEAQRKLDELRTKYHKAKAKVAELNFRFGDWYYIISEESFAKIRLKRSELTKDSPEAKEKGDDIDAFRKLQEEGLSK